MPLPTHLRPLQLAVALTATGMVFSACSGGDNYTPGPTVPSRASSHVGDVAGAVEASWEQIPVDPEAVASDDRVEFDGVLPATNKQPALVYGSLSVFGEGSRAATWTANGEVGDLGLGDESGITDATVAGKATYLIGTVREDGERAPFLVSSTNRTTWEREPLPPGVSERQVRFTDLAVPRGASPVLLGIDADDKPVAVVPGDSGTVVDLPMPARRGTMTYFGGAAAHGKRILALATLEAKDGRTRLVGYHSDDAGSTWELVGAPSDLGAFVNGIAVAGNQFVATGGLTAGTNSLPTAWSTQDGTTWRREPTPVMNGHADGWSSWLSQPANDGSAVEAMLVDDMMLDAAVVRRGPDAVWRLVSTTPSWIAPGAGSSIGANGSRTMLVARSWNGRGQIGHLVGSIFTRTADLGAAPKFSGWNSIGLIGDEPTFTGYTSRVRLDADGGWRRTSTVTPYAIRDNELTKSSWQPRPARGVSEIMYASDPEAGSVALGTRPFTRDEQSANGSDVVGWYRQEDAGQWRQAVGLADGRSEFLSSVSRVGNTWVAVGYDRASLVGSAPYIGAVWTSENGWRWERAQGDFGLDTGPKTSVNAACEAPNGDVMAVGGEDDATLGSVPKIWTSTGGRWTTVDASGLGRTTAALFHCVKAGDITLLQASGQARDVTFRTDDGTTFTKVKAGDDRDGMGRIRQVGNGFAASGYIDQDGTTIPVVWLSADGIAWKPTVVPSEREASTSDVLERDGDLIVPLMSSAGPEVWVVSNADELVNNLS